LRLSLQRLLPCLLASDYLPYCFHLVG
jgi:hypothetical protein